MNFSLDNHIKKYDLIYDDIKLSLLTGLSGAPYAGRHWEMFNTTHAWGHKAIAVLEYTPFIGALAALIERVAVLAYHKIFDKPSVWPRKEPLNQETCIKKMLRNSAKTMTEHIRRGTVGVCKDFKVVTPSQQKPQATLSFTHEAVGEAGNHRPSMEDAHFIIENEQGLLAGVFDGHGGHEVADHSSDKFKDLFFPKLKELNGHVHEAFESVINKIQQEVQTLGTYQGCTVVVTFVDKHTHLVYTATLGDSEANIYRNVDNRLTSIPLSCVRDWSSPKDAQRGDLFMKNSQWRKKKHAKMMRIENYRSSTINVSRAIGDIQFKPAITHKPKITLHQAKPDDLLILACDGLKDFVPENEMIEQITAHGSKPGLAQKLVDYSIDKHHDLANDNVTVVAIRIR